MIRLRPTDAWAVITALPMPINGKDAQVVEDDVSGFMEQCVERYLELANVTVDTLKTVATPCA